MTYATTPAAPRTPGRFAQTPQWVTQRVRSGPALRVYEHLAAQYCDDNRFCYPYQTTIADDLGYGLRTVERALRTLRDASAVVVLKSRKLNGHWGRNAYLLPMIDPTDATATAPNVDLSDQEEQGIVAGGNHPPVEAGRQPDPSKDLKPLNQRSKEEDQNLEHGDVPSPSARSADGRKKNFEHQGTCPEADRNDHETSPLPAPPPGVQPPTDQHQAGEAANGSFVEINSFAPDDLGVGWADDDELGLTLHEEYPGYLDATYPNWCDWEEQRRERLTELIEKTAYYLPPGHEMVIESMLNQGAHWKKIVHTLEKQ